MGTEQMPAADPDRGAAAGQPAVPAADQPGGPAADQPGGPAADQPGGPAADQPGGPPLHPSLGPLRFLVGRWEGAGVVGYPTIESAQFGQEISFSHNGKPFLSYASRTWLLDSDGRIGRPLASESGFWRLQDDGTLEVMLAHPTGITEIYLGAVAGTKIEMATDVVARTATAREVTAGRRLYGLIGADLGYAYDMAAVGQPLQAHLSAQLKHTG